MSASVPLRPLGANDPLVPAIGLGLMGFTGVYGQALHSREEQMKFLDAASEMGETFWDTADIYGDNEPMLATWFARTGHRSSIFLATKFAMLMESGTAKFLGVDSSGAYCKKQCEDSLKKLGTEYIDLYYAHRLNPETPIEETMRALKELQDAGKIRHIGLCEPSSTTLRRACAIAHVSAVQMEYSPFVREIEDASGTDLLKTCRELGVAVVCSSPLGRGLLTPSAPASVPEATVKDTTGGPKEGKGEGDDDKDKVWGGIGDVRGVHMPWFKLENIEKNRAIVDAWGKFAEKKGISVSQLSLSWLLKQGGDIFPIPGTTNIKRLEENVAAAKIEWSDEEEAEMRRFLEQNPLEGYRSTEGSKKFAFVDTVEET